MSHEITYKRFVRFFNGQNGLFNVIAKPLIDSVANGRMTWEDVLSVFEMLDAAIRIRKMQRLKSLVYREIYIAVD